MSYELHQEKTSSKFQTRSDTSWPVQSQEKAIRSTFSAKKGDSDSALPLLKSEIFRFKINIFRFKASSKAAQVGLCQIWMETTKTPFSGHGSY